MTLREKIKTYLNDWQGTTGYDNHDMNRLVETYVDSILAAVREAMLENSAGFIVAKDRNGEVKASFDMGPWMKDVLTAAGITESEVENDTD